MSMKSVCVWVGPELPFSLVSRLPDVIGAGPFVVIFFSFPLVKCAENESSLK